MDTKLSMKYLVTAILIAIFSVTATSVIAQDYPSKAVNYVIPFGPGGESDITARHQAPFFKKLFGKDLIISYKPGGGGAVGWAQLNKMKGDGYNIIGINLPHIILKPQQKAVGFKTEDITGVYMFHYTPDAIVVNKDSEFKTLKDIIDYAKSNPGTPPCFSRRGLPSGPHGTCTVVPSSWLRESPALVAWGRRCLYP